MVLSKCSSIIGVNGETSQFDEYAQQNVVKGVIDPMASNGLRTIAVAYRDISAEHGKTLILYQNINCSSHGTRGSVEIHTLSQSVEMLPLGDTNICILF